MKTPPLETMDFVSLSPTTEEKLFVSKEMSHQLLGSNQFLLWVDSSCKLSCNNSTEQLKAIDEKINSKLWSLVWRRPDRKPVLLGSLSQSGLCTLENTPGEPLALVERFDKNSRLKNSNNIGRVNVAKPDDHELISVEQLADGPSRILQLHIHHPFKPEVRIVKVEPTSARCICCLLCSTRNSKFELTIFDGFNKIGTVSGTINGENMPTTQLPTPYLLMNVNFNQSADSEIRFSVLSGLLVGAIQQVFLYFDLENIA